MKIIKIMIFLLLTHVPYGQTMEEMPKGTEVKQEDKSGVLTSAITGIELSCFGNVFLNQGEQESLIVEANENILPHIIINIRQGILTFEVSDVVPRTRNSTLNFYLTLRNLRHIIISRSGSVVIQNDFRTPKLTVTVGVNGFGKVRINNLITTDFYAEINGCGNVEVKGTTKNQRILISDKGDYKGKEFNAEYSDITILDEGDVEITTKKVHYYIAGGELSGELIANGHRIEY